MNVSSDMLFWWEPVSLTCDLGDKPTLIFENFNLDDHFLTMSSSGNISHEHFLC